jgi:hypothetical protein
LLAQTFPFHVGVAYLKLSSRIGMAGNLCCKKLTSHHLQRTVSSNKLAERLR